VGIEHDDPRIEKALHYVYEVIDAFYNFQGLLEVKEKFHPNWESRYLVVPRMTSLSNVLIAYPCRFRL
jgi:phosphatidylglycerol lysyltransferase